MSQTSPQSSDPRSLIRYACIALAEGIAGSEAAFADMMNKEAARLGMKETHFTNASGLPGPEHYTTVYDLSLLAAALVRVFGLAPLHLSYPLTLSLAAVAWLTAFGLYLSTYARILLRPRTDGREG